MITPPSQCSRKNFVGPPVGRSWFRPVVLNLSVSASHMMTRSGLAGRKSLWRKPKRKRGMSFYFGERQNVIKLYTGTILCFLFEIFDLVGLTSWLINPISIFITLNLVLNGHLCRILEYIFWKFDLRAVRILTIFWSVRPFIWLQISLNTSTELRWFYNPKNIYSINKNKF